MTTAAQELASLLRAYAENQQRLVRVLRELALERQSAPALATLGEQEAQSPERSERLAPPEEVASPDGDFGDCDSRSCAEESALRAGGTRWDEVPPELEAEVPTIARAVTYVDGLAVEATECTADLDLPVRTSDEQLNGACGPDSGEPRMFGAAASTIAGNLGRRRKTTGKTKTRRDYNYFVDLERTLQLLNEDVSAPAPKS